MRRRRARAAQDEARIVWIFGSPRSGTTWLMNQLGRAPGVVKVDEPLIGAHLGLFAHEYFGSPAAHFGSERSLISQLLGERNHYFFADQYADAWRSPLRELILARFAAQMRDAGNPGGICLVKEPNGTQGIGLLLQALPDSRVLWLLRDGRDVVDSELDGTLPGGWTERYGATWEMDAEQRLRFLEDHSVRWLRRTEYVQEQFARLAPEQRLLLRYEDLLADTVSGLEQAFAWLGHRLAPGEAADIAARHAFERLPSEQTGAGKFARQAKVGGWRDSRSAQEQQVMQAVMGAKLEELGYA